MSIGSKGKGKSSEVRGAGDVPLVPEDAGKAPDRSRIRTYQAEAPLSAMQAASNRQSYSGEKVIVASKLDMAITIQAEKLLERRVTAGNMAWQEEYWVKVGEPYYIRGIAVARGEGAAAYPMPMTEGGFALTFNIPIEVWESFERSHGDTPMFRNGLIFAHTKRADIKAHARDNRGMESGLGPLTHGVIDGQDQLTDPRRPQALSMKAALHNPADIEGIDGEAAEAA